MNKNNPVLTLSMDDKIYLAVAKSFSEPFSFVYTLACNRQKKSGQYDMVASANIHTFKDKGAAHVYHDTIAQLVEINEGTSQYKMLFDLNKVKIEAFEKLQR